MSAPAEIPGGSSRLVIHFTHLRPYHLARLRSAEQAFLGSGMETMGLAVVDSTGNLPVNLPIFRPERPPLILFPNQPKVPSASETRQALHRALDRLHPSAVAICGYATPDARECLRWCRRHKAKAILMTETRKRDGPRAWWKEWIKSRIVRSFDGALCGGPEARAYLEKLGMSPDRIAEGYDVVDNHYFASESDRIRAEEGGTVYPYFLGSNRFIPRKNVSGLIEAYALYVKSCPLSIVRGPWSEVTKQKPEDNAQKTKIENPQSSIVNQSPSWNLCLLGDGELKADLIAQCHRLGLTVQESAPWESSLAPDSCPLNPGLVFFPGWRSHAELPRFYAHAGAFVHPAISEPWGLVVNEAMASALPVLVSPGTGAASTLAGVGTAVASFNPASPEIAARALEVLATSDDDTKHAAAKESRAHVQSHASSSAFGMGLTSLC